MLLYFSVRTKQKINKYVRYWIKVTSITLYLSTSLISLIRYYVQKQTSWDDLMRNSSETKQQIYRRTTVQKSDFHKVASDRLLRKPEPRPWTWTLKNLAHETWETDGWKDWKIWGPHNIIYYNNKILQEETCK